MERTKILISYAHNDGKWLQRLQKHLASLDQQNRIIHFDDNRTIGQRWQEELARALDTTAVAVLLVSEDFLASEYMTSRELPRLLQRHAADSPPLCVMPVLVGECAYAQSDLATYKSLNPPSQALDHVPRGQADRYLYQLVQQVEQQLTRRPTNPAIAVVAERPSPTGRFERVDRTSPSVRTERTGRTVIASPTAVWLHRLWPVILTVGLVLMIRLLGGAALDARDRIWGLEGHISLEHASGTLWKTGVSALGRLFIWMFAGLGAGKGQERWAAPACALMALALWQLAHRIGPESRAYAAVRWAFVPALAVLAVAVGLYAQTVSVHHLVIGERMPSGIQPAAAHYETFAAYRWLREHDNPRNQGRLAALAGSWGWLMTALAVVGASLLAETRRLRRGVSPSGASDPILGVFLPMLATATGVLVVWLGIQGGPAYALRYWGISAPRVTASDPDCRPLLTALLEKDDCVVFDVSSDAEQEAVLPLGLGCTTKHKGPILVRPAPAIVGWPSDRRCLASQGREPMINRTDLAAAVPAVPADSH